jgi:acetyl-CoA carboxylase carboxyltransferase component
MERDMAENRNIYNTGSFVGGDVKDSTISVNTTASASEAEVLQRLRELLSSLPEQAEEHLDEDDAAEVSGEVTRLKKQLAAAERDPGRMRATVDKIVAAAAAAAPIAAIARQISDLVGSLPH